MRGLSVIIVVVGLALARTAVADDLSHKGQFGVHVQPGVGYRVLFPYNEEYCGEADKSVCTGRAPFFLDIGASYAPVPKIELLAEIRLGVEKDFSGGGSEGPRPFAYALGLRLFVDGGGKAKFFSSIEGVIETTDYSKTAGVDGGTDYGLRNVNGFQIDFSDALGLYFHFGETVTFVNWLRFELHGGIGLQARFP